MQTQLVSSESYTIRPAARHILTIGKGIIKDNLTAIGELVKNSYDADASEVKIVFEKLDPVLSKIAFLKKVELEYPSFDGEELFLRLQKIKSEDDQFLEDNKLRRLWLDTVTCFKISIEDNGLGLSRETILNHWLVPSTNNKFKKQVTLKGRDVQGRKGIGRYAASILGDDFLMDTIDKSSGIQSIVVIDWSDFQNEKYEYLDQVPILIESYQSSAENHGTKIQIVSPYNWEGENLSKLILFLERLFLITNVKKDQFDIFLYFKNFQPPFNLDDNNRYHIVSNADLFEKIFHYRVFGKITFENNVIVATYSLENTIEKKLISNLKKVIDNDPDAFCGEINFDLKVFDQDERGLNDLKSQFSEISNFTNKQVRRILEEAEGISIYRNKFRIRPYGDNRSFDWLGLNARRINQPSKRLGTKQINGIIEIDSEEKSGLIEKATREGLKEDSKFESLINQILSLVTELENERNISRDKNGSRVKTYFDHEILSAQIFDFERMYKKVESELVKAQVSLAVIQDVNRVIQSVEAEKTSTIAKINEKFVRQEETFKNTIATYQVQATLGKIINIIIHEGRNPLAYLKETSGNIKVWVKSLSKLFTETYSIEDSKLTTKLNNIDSRSDGIIEQTKALLRLFEKLESISITRRNIAKPFPLGLAINKSFDLFESKLREDEITYIINCHSDFQLTGWEFDLITVFTNLIDNSLHWLKFSKSSRKEIKIDVSQQNDQIFIRYLDNGLGIEEHLLKDQRIFEPGFTTKSNGMGLGLAISGEAVERNGGILSAIYNPNGAEFNIVFNLK